MVTVADLKARLDARPFVAFTLATTRTGRYRVGSAADVLLTRTTLYIAHARDVDGIPNDAIAIPLRQIAKLEP